MKNVWRSLSRPSARFSSGAIAGVGLLIGIFIVLSFDFAMESTSTEEFCLSCHEMSDNVGREFVGTIHDVNPSGMRATCADCHVPQEFWPKMWRKVRASVEVYHNLLGTIDTPEKFEAHRERMARRVWAEMNSNDSRECRTCHLEEKWDVNQQSAKAVRYHQGPLAAGKTCIDCHKGDAHQLPAGFAEDSPLEGIDF